MPEKSDPELPECDAFEAYDAEIRRLDQHFAACGASDWKKPSRCEGWDTKDILSHIISVDLYNLLCLNVGGIDRLDQDSMRQAASLWHSYVDDQRSRSTDDLLTEWRERNAEVRKGWEERGLDNTVATMVGQYPLRAQVFHIGNEIATHADDIYVDVALEDRASRDDWRAIYSRFALDEYSRPIEVEIGDDDVTLILGDESITLSKRDFVDATVDRLPDDFENLPSPEMMRALRLVP